MNKKLKACKIHLWHEFSHGSVIKISKKTAEILISGAEVQQCIKCKMFRQSTQRWHYFFNE